MPRLLNGGSQFIQNAKDLTQLASIANNPMSILNAIRQNDQTAITDILELIQRNKSYVTKLTGGLEIDLTDYKIATIIDQLKNKRTKVNGIINFLLVNSDKVNMYVSDKNNQDTLKLKALDVLDNPETLISTLDELKTAVQQNPSTSNGKTSTPNIKSIQNKIPTNMISGGVVPENIDSMASMIPNGIIPENIKSMMSNGINKSPDPCEIIEEPVTSTIPTREEMEQLVENKKPFIWINPVGEKLWECF